MARTVQDNIAGRRVPTDARSIVSAKVGLHSNHLLSDIPRVRKHGSSTLPYYFE